MCDCVKAGRWPINHSLRSEENYRYLAWSSCLIIRNTLPKAITNRAGRVSKLIVSGKNEFLITNSWILAKLRYYLAAVRFSKRKLISLDRAVWRRF